MKRFESLRAAAVAIALAIPVVLPAHAQDAAATSFPKDIMDKPEYVELGIDVFQRTCRFCHGKGAYPGKAPTLKPTQYTPEFVYDRVTNGFRGMPPLKDMLSEKERQAVTVYIKSQGFSN